MENSPHGVREGHEFDGIQALSMLLATMTAGGGEAECTRLLATGVSALFPCDLSGLALHQEEGWKCVVQKDGELLSEPHTHSALTDLDPLFKETLSRDRLLLSPAADDESTSLLSPFFESFDVQHVAIVPLRTLQRNLGMLFVGTRDKDQFSREEASLIQILAEHSALAIENFRLHESLQEYSRNLHEVVEERLAQLRLSEGEYHQKPWGRS